MGVKVRCGEELVAELRELAKSDARLAKCAEEGLMNAEEVKILVRMRKERKSECQPLRNLVAGVEFPKEEVKKENPELEKRREWLMARQAAREYRASIANLVPGQSAVVRKNAMGEIRSTMKELSVGFSMILLCVGVFFALKLWADSTGRPPSVGIIWGLFGASGMLMIEMVLFVIRSTRDEKHERIYKKFMEHKQTHNISSFPFHGNASGES